MVSRTGLAKALLAAALTAAGWVVPAAAATSVERCLAAPYYPDGSEAMRICGEAIQQKDLPPATAAKINLQLGQAIFFAHRPGLAIQYLSEAIRLDPSLDQAWRRRGWAYGEMARGSEAMADFTTFLELRPGDPDGLFAITYERNRDGSDCAGKAKELESILAKHPKHYLSRWNLAHAYECIDRHQGRALEQIEAILADGRKAIADTVYYSRRGPDDHDFYAAMRDQRNLLFWRMSRWDLVISESTWLINEYPNNFDGFSMRAGARYQIADYVGALADSESALDLWAGHLHAQGTKIEALNKLKRFDDVIAYAGDVLQSGGTNFQTPTILMTRALAYKALGRREDAIDDINAAMAMDGQRIWTVHTQLAQAGFVFGPPVRYGEDPNPDITSPEFVNALQACVIDPECLL